MSRYLRVARRPSHTATLRVPSFPCATATRASSSRQVSMEWFISIRRPSSKLTSYNLDARAYLPA
jgi:hypothetical protein